MDVLFLMFGGLYMYMIITSLIDYLAAILLKRKFKNYIEIIRVCCL